ncbi:MAG: TonB family protein [Bacteroidales bacterium]|nr:TonB family protein [Bacteroidales bacterium]
MMHDILIYMLKVSLGIGFVSLSYLLLRNDTALVTKRFYLVAGVLASWIFPFLRFPGIFPGNGPDTVTVPAAQVSVSPAGIPVAAGEVQSHHFNWLLPVVILYVLGAAILFTRHIISLGAMRRKIRESGSSGDIIFSKTNRVFTLFNRVFIPESMRHDPGLEPVLMHERAHIKQLHFIDLLIVELTLVFTWFNPFTWLVSRMIKENHEHLADRLVLSSGVSPAHYRAQLINLSLGVNYFRLAHQFNYSLTKKRFKMMKRTERKRFGILKYFIVIPLVLSAMAVFTASKVSAQDAEVRGSVYFADTGRPAQGASVIVKGTTRGTMVNSTGTFSPDCESDEIITISFIGYKTIEIEAGEITDRPLMLEEKSYELDLEKVDSNKNSKVKIEVKGKSGLEDANPVIVVDGKIVDNIDEVDPGDIENVTVIKDKSSELAKKYNAEGGLILVNLKKRAKGSDEPVFVVVEDMPEYPGGLPALKAYIYENLQYPAKAKEEGIEGKVVVEFVVNKSGKAEDIKILESSYKGFNSAAMEVFSNMPEWKPGKQRGKPVRAKLQVPVEFILGKE